MKMGKAEGVLQKKSNEERDESPRGLERVKRVLDELKEDPKPTEFFLKRTIRADGASIENQEINIIQEKDGLRVITFKLTEKEWRSVVEKMRAIGVGVSDGEIRYGNVRLCKCIQFQNGDITMRVAKPPEENHVRCSHGLVRIEINAGDHVEKQMGVGETMDDIETILSKVFKNPESFLSPPEEDDVERYKEARWRWSHKMALDDDLTEEQKKTVSALVGEEVFPEYHTFLEKGRGERMVEQGPFLLSHDLYNMGTIESIVTSGGLMATHERFRRGGFIHGQSSNEDLARGGGDGVFMMMFSESTEKADGCSWKKKIPEGGIIVFDPAVLDRTDYYCFENDRYGDTGDDFLSRITPEYLLDEQLEFGSILTNELIFRCGISLRDMKYIVFPKDSQGSRDTLCDTLRAKGVSIINGISVEEFFRVENTYLDVLALVNPEAVEQLRNKKNEVKDIAEEVKLNKQGFSEGDIVVGNNLASCYGLTGPGVKVKIIEKSVGGLMRVELTEDSLQGESFWVAKNCFELIKKE